MWSIILSFKTETNLHFLVAGHTKNVCDGAFGHVKRRLKRTDVYTPRDMMDCIRTSHIPSIYIPSIDVSWRDWKSILDNSFVSRNNFKIKQYHHFKFPADDIGVVYA